MPFFRFPFFYNPSYYNRFSNYNYVSRLHNQPNSHFSLNNGNLNISSKDGTNKNNTKNNFDNSYLINEHIVKNNSSKSNNVFNDSTNSRNQTENNNEDNYFFEIFGLKLFFDDILLICFIFFLYQEGVKDNELFLSLILLLLS